MERTVNFETPRVVGEKVVLTTTLSVGDFVDKIARFEVNEMQRITRFAGNIKLPTIDEMRHYLVTLLQVRVQHVNGQRQNFNRLIRTVRVPSRWFILLAQIGIAKDHSRKFEFVPNLELPEKFEGMDIEQVEEISWLMESLLQEGYMTSPGVPLAIDGSLEFMAKTKIGNIIKGMDTDNAVYGFLAAILENDVASDSYDNLDLIFRIQYSTMDTYSAAFQSYFVQSANILGGMTNEQKPTNTTTTEKCE